MGRPFKCPYCASTETVSKGVRKNKTVGVRRVRRCTACRRKFTPKNQPPFAAEDAPVEPELEVAEQEDEDAEREPYYQPSL